MNLLEMLYFEMKNNNFNLKKWTDQKGLKSWLKNN